MNAAFKSKVVSAGIDFTRFLVGIGAALAEANNPKYSALIGQGAVILDAHMSTLNDDDATPAAVGEVAKADPNGGFPGAPRPGSTGAAVNGHVDGNDTTAPENKAGYIEPSAVKAAPVSTASEVGAAMVRSVTPAAAVAVAPAPAPSPVVTSPTLESRVGALESNIGQILALLQAAQKQTNTPAQDTAATPGEHI